MEARNNTKSICGDNNDDNKQQKRNKKKKMKKDKGGESSDCKEGEETEVKDRDLAPSPSDLPPDRTAYYAKYSTQIQDDGPNVRDNTPSYANIYNIPP